MAGSAWSNQAVYLMILTEEVSGQSGIFGYSPTPGPGNLVFSVSAAAGVDSYGNSYPAGVNSTEGFFTGSIPGTDIVAGTLPASACDFTATSIGGITTYVQGTTPSGSINAGSLWIDTSAGNAIYQYTSGTWSLYQFGTGSIQANSISAAQIIANTITATQLAAGIVYAGIVDGTLIEGAQFVAYGSTGEILIYSGPPATNNLVGWFSEVAGVDSYGNNYGAGLNVGGYYDGSEGNSYAALVPAQDAPFDVTTAISGTLEAIVALSTGSSTEGFAGFLGSLTLNSGTSAKNSLAMASPSMNTFGTGVAAMILESQNQGATDTAVITFGTIASPDSETFVFSPVMTISPYALLMYAGSSGQTAITKTSGSGTIPDTWNTTSRHIYQW